MKQLLTTAQWTSSVSPKIVTKENPLATVMNIRDEVIFTYNKSIGEVSFEIQYSDRTYGTRSTYSVNGGPELTIDLIDSQSTVAVPTTSNHMVDLTNEPTTGTITLFLDLGVRKFLRLKGAITKILTFSKYDVPSYSNIYCGGASSLISVPKSIPKHWTSINNIFAGCRLLNDPNLSYWNTENLTDIAVAFYLNSLLNVPLFWNVANVTNANYFLRDARNFNQDLSKWCVAKLTTAPRGFASLTPIEILTEKLPVWGTCPVS